MPSEEVRQLRSRTCLAAWLPGGYLSTHVEISPRWRCTIRGRCTSSGVPLKVYRAQLPTTLFAGLCALVFFILGLSMMLDERESGGASSVVVGALVLLLSHSGPVMVYCVAGTGRYVARAADELRELQRTYAPNQAADGVPPGALSS
jgi:hypothetical protein